MSWRQKLFLRPCACLIRDTKDVCALFPLFHVSHRPPSLSPSSCALLYLTPPNVTLLPKQIAFALLSRSTCQFLVGGGRKRVPGWQKSDEVSSTSAKGWENPTFSSSIGCLTFPPGSARKFQLGANRQPSELSPAPECDLFWRVRGKGSHRGGVGR